MTCCTLGCTNLGIPLQTKRQQLQAVSEQAGPIAWPSAACARGLARRTPKSVRSHSELLDPPRKNAGRLNGSSNTVTLTSVSHTWLCLHQQPHDDFWAAPTSLDPSRPWAMIWQPASRKQKQQEAFAQSSIPMETDQGCLPRITVLAGNHA